MKTMKRLLTLLLALTLVLGMAMPAYAATTVASGTCGKNVTWTLDSEGTLTISGTGAMGVYEYSSDIPWYNYKDSINQVIIETGVTSIGDFAFSDCSSLTSITIPKGVTSIGYRAFYGCSSLTSITIPEGVTNIGGSAFEGCSSLTSITIPEGVTSIGSSAFSDCSSLTGITILGSVTSIGDWAFSCCSSLTSITIPEGVTSISRGAFSNCRSLTSITIPEGVTSIEWYAFECCSSLTSITIPDSVTSIGGWAFNWCSRLTSITIPGSVTSIGKLAFAYCKSLTSITILEGVTSIGDEAFPYCDSLTSITIPGSVTSIGRSAFCGCSSLTSVTIPGSVTSIGEAAFCGCSLTSITIPESVTSIGEAAFKNCSSLTSITIPKSVTSIGDEAFSLCSSLTSIWVDKNNKNYSSDTCGVLFDKNKTTLIAAPGAISGTYVIPESVTSIGDWAFYGCSSMTSITIPEGVTSIGYKAFYNCSSLTSITIPEGVTSIGGYAFEDCSSLTEITFEGDVPRFGFNVFSYVTATAYYPADNATWTEEVRQDCGDNLTWVGYTPKTNPYKITNVVSGVHVYWKAIDGVAKYGLWRSETGKNGTYKWVANPTVAHFTDTKVESGKTYYYKVTTMDGSGKHSAKSSAIGLTYVSTPDISARYNKAAGVKLDWKKVTGATGYAIYRKSYSGNDAWVRVATISGNSTFTWTDTSVKNNNGTAYKYTIRALTGSDMKTLSGCRNAGRSMVRLTSRTLTGASKASATSIKCSWNTSSAVTGYEVRFMVGSTVYKTFTVGNYKIGTKVFTGLKAGQTYKIQVRSYRKIDGMGFYSAWSTAKNVTL